MCGVKNSEKNRTAEIATNDRKMGWNWDSDRENHKYNDKSDMA